MDLERTRIGLPEKGQIGWTMCVHFNLRSVPSSPPIPVTFSPGSFGRTTVGRLPISMLCRSERHDLAMLALGIDIVRPGLHHFLALRQILRAVVRAATWLRLV